MPPAIGSTAPASRALDAQASGGPGVPATVDLAALAAGGPLVLAFTKRDCGACVALAPALPRLAAIPGLTVAVVSQDPRPEAAALAAAQGWVAPLRVLVDPEPWPASDAWATLATPTVVLVERGGRVAEVLEGWSRRDVNALAARAAVLAGAAPIVVSPPGEGPDFRPG